MTIRQCPYCKGKPNSGKTYGSRNTGDSRFMMHRCHWMDHFQVGRSYGTLKWSWNLKVGDHKDIIRKLEDAANLASWKAMPLWYRIKFHVRKCLTF